MKTIFYGDPAPTQLIPNSIFLAGCSVSPKAAERTEWRLDALSMLKKAGFTGTVIIPEFESGGFRREFFNDGLPSTVPGMSRSSERIIAWETAGIDNARALLAWMPFALGIEGQPDSLPGFSTRAEVMRAITMKRPRLVLGMPPIALAGGQIRFHAHRASYEILDVLEDVVLRALVLAGIPISPAEMPRIELGIDGDHAFALLGEDIQSGEVEFVKLRGDDLSHKLIACKKAASLLRARLGRPELSYVFGPSHPYGGA